MEYPDELVLSPDFMTSMYTGRYLRSSQILKIKKRKIIVKEIKVKAKVEIAEIKKKRYYPKVFTKKRTLLLKAARE